MPRVEVAYATPPGHERREQAGHCRCDLITRCPLQPAQRLAFVLVQAGSEQVTVMLLPEGSPVQLELGEGHLVLRLGHP